MDDIETRLRETSENCFNAFEAWEKNRKDGKAREGLLDSIHELRKVASRLEIELAISERNQMTQKPLDIPPHRDANRKPGGKKQDDDNAGNRGHSEEKVKLKPSRRKPAPKKADGDEG